MKVLETVAEFLPDGKIVAAGQGVVAPGRHRVTMLINETIETEPASGDPPALYAGIFATPPYTGEMKDPNCTFGRDWIYSDEDQSDIR